MPEIRNPNAGGGAGGNQDNRSFLLMMLVMLGVVFGLQYWRARHNPQTAEPSAPSAVAAPSPQNPGVNNPAALGSTAADPGQPSTVSLQASTESTTVVENELYRITFSNRGGQAVSWILKRYKDNEGNPLDLVHDGAARQFGYPLSLYTYDANLTRTLSQALFVPSATGTLQSPATLSFNYQAGDLKVTKTFSFAADYVIKADIQVLRNGSPVAADLAWPAGLGDMETAQGYAGATIDTMSNGKEDHEAFKKIVGGSTENGPFDWAGTADQYFGAVFLPDRPADATLVTLHNQIDVNKVQRRVGQGAPAKGSLMVPVLGAAIGDRTGHVQTRVFVGPKAVPVLKAVTSASGHSLEPLLDFGFWGPVGKFLFLGLQFTYAHVVRSWGWAIILFTLLINLVLLPLRVQSMRAALKMQRIQPQIDTIKAKYKNPKPTDPKAAEMNQEIMAFQKEQGVSMFGGCIPTLVQLPLLFAFFTMMTKVVELRQAHFWWLPDLSSADPYHILPIVMVLTSFAVQYFTPMPGQDPQQQKMMAFMMPAFSGYMTWNYASGLALYWNVGNLIMIIQQQVMNRTRLGREMREAQQERARKKQLTQGVKGRTIQARR
ncbi:MAG TPA: membrane protein insertase YidC [Acidobacteriaceae bacterium]|nr:membrane protein insertase YidC [Acidobacteriaceae bacterium]